MGNFFIGRAYAFCVGLSPNGSLPKGTNSCSPTSTYYANFNSYLLDLFSAAINIAGLLAVLMILWGAFKYISASGDEAKVRDAKDTIVGAVIGFALLVLIKVLLPLIQIQ